MRKTKQNNKLDFKMSNCAHVFIFLPFRYNRNYPVNTINVKTWLRKKKKQNSAINRPKLGLIL